VIETLTFAQAVWLFCPAFVLHVLEEWPRFTGWARLHASARFTQRDYNVIHAAGVAMSLLAALIVSRFPNRPVVFIFFAFVFTPAALFNTLFHLGASVLTRSYCPGAITAVAIYLPLFAVITTLAYREGLLGMGALIATLVLAGGFHAWEVGHNVFKAW
jgi:uncharacterized protein with HXXEE motif